LERGQSGEEGDAVNADLDVLGRLERLENRLEAVVAALEQRAGQGTSALV
jgi:tetrahydromethanopterin S-methyltransferase subunit G